MQIKDKVALVTGSAHRVGKAIAIALAREGAQLVVHYGGADQAAQQTVAEISALGVRAIAQQADLRDPAAIDALINRVETEFGQLDILVNSASNFIRKSFDEATVEDWKDIMQTNLRAPFLLTQRAAKLMRQMPRPAAEPAVIINIADILGLHYRAGLVLHGLSKSGLIQLTRLSAFEYAPDIRVNAVAPGPVLPPPGIDEDSERWQKHGRELPLQRVGNPQEVAHAVTFLVQNDYITGVLLPVDGGEHLSGSR